MKYKNDYDKLDKNLKSAENTNQEKNNDIEGLNKSVENKEQEIAKLQNEKDFENTFSKKIRTSCC